METVFPEAQGTAGAFVVGWHMGAGGPEQVGVAVVKRTYDLDGGALVPSASPLPVFLTDEPGALLVNGDVEAAGASESEAVSWTPTGATTATRQPEAGDPSNHVLGVSGSGGHVRQSATLGRRLGHQPVALSLRADATGGAHAAARVVTSAGTLCSLSTGDDDPAADDPPDLYAASGTPGGLASRTLTVELDPPDDDAETAHYDDVVLATTAYEADVVPTKPAGDLVVLDHRAAASVTVSVDGVERMSGSGAAVFGWEPRLDSPREAFAGDEPVDVLPTGFDDRFFNGFRRAASASASPPHLPSDAAVAIDRDGEETAFSLLGETVTAEVAYHGGDAPDGPPCWRRFAVAMALDTLVVETDEDRCTAVWRGAWPFAQVAPDAYRRLTVTLS